MTRKYKEFDPDHIFFPDGSVIEKIKYQGNIKAAEMLGSILAKKLKEKGINKIVFDRGGYLYHGRVKAVAENVRKENIKF